MDAVAQENDETTEAIIGAALEVHHRLGCGFLERVYQQALAVEFQAQGIPFEREVLLPIEYRGRVLACAYRVDFVCNGAVMVETKATHELGTHDFAQLLNYLKAGRMRLGLLINFGDTRLQVRRFVN